MVRGMRLLLRTNAASLSQASLELQQGISHSAVQRCVALTGSENADHSSSVASTSGRAWQPVHVHLWSGERGFAAKAEKDITSKDDVVVFLAQYDAEWEKVLDAPPTDLYFDRGADKIPPFLDSPFGKLVFNFLGGNSHKSKLIYGGQRLYGSIIAQGNDATLQRAVGLDPKVFFATYAILTVHLWLVVRRLKAWNHKDAKFFRNRFYKNFNQDVEFRMQKSGIEVGVAGWLKKLEKIMFTACIQMDEVLDGKSSGKSLSDVLLKNFYGNDERLRDGANVLARYVSRELLCISMTDQEAVIKGHVRWSCPESLLELDEAASSEDTTGGDGVGAGSEEGAQVAVSGGQVAQAAAVPLPKD